MSKKSGVLIVFYLATLAAILYKNKKNTTYYIGKAEVMRDELERKIAEKTQGDKCI